MINEQYLAIIEPTEFIKNFKSENEFLEWLDTGTVEDVGHTLRAFEQANMYEICTLIKRYLINEI